MAAIPDTDFYLTRHQAVQVDENGDKDIIIFQKKELLVKDKIKALGIAISQYEKAYNHVIDRIRELEFYYHNGDRSEIDMEIDAEWDDIDDDEFQERLRVMRDYSAELHSKMMELDKRRKDIIKFRKLGGSKPEKAIDVDLISE